MERATVALRVPAELQSRCRKWITGRIAPSIESVGLRLAQALVAGHTHPTPSGAPRSFNRRLRVRVPSVAFVLDKSNESGKPATL